jgi:hypothetical protein
MYSQIETACRLGELSTEINLEEEVMTDPEQADDDAGTAKYDIVRLLRYQGPILHQKRLSGDTSIILDYRSTDQNERNISLLLSSQGINFTLVRPPEGWRRGTRIVVTVPKERYQEAQVLLAAAAALSLLEVVPGTKSP